MEIQGFTSVKDTTSFVKMLLYGHPGSGKTRFAATAPNPVFFDWENSSETLRHEVDFADTQIKKNIDVLQIFPIIDKLVKDPNVETIILDSVTSALDMFLRKQLEKKVKENPGKRDEFILFEADYKYATQVFTKLFNELTVAPKNVVVIFHEGIARHPETQQITGIFPDVTPRLRQAVTRLVNIVAYLEAKHSQVKETTRKLYVNPTSIIEAKNRLHIQKVAIENPEWKELTND